MRLGSGGLRYGGTPARGVAGPTSSRRKDQEIYINI